MSEGEKKMHSFIWHCILQQHPSVFFVPCPYISLNNVDWVNFDTCLSCCHAALHIYPTTNKQIYPKLLSLSCLSGCSSTCHLQYKSNPIGLVKWRKSKVNKHRTHSVSQTRPTASIAPLLIHLCERERCIHNTTPRKHNSISIGFLILLHCRLFFYRVCLSWDTLILYTSSLYNNSKSRTSHLTSFCHFIPLFFLFVIIVHYIHFTTLLYISQRCTMQFTKNKLLHYHHSQHLLLKKTQ